MTQTTSLPLADIEPATLTKSRIAAIVGVSERTISNAVRDGSFPPPDVQVGAKCARWRESTIRAWLAAQQEKAVAHAS